MANQQEALLQAQNCLQDYKKELAKRLLQVEEFEFYRAVAEEYILAFPEAMADPNSVWNSAETRTIFTLDSSCFHAVILTRDMKTIKELTEPLRWLRERLGKYTVDDDKDMKRRVYKFADGKFVFQAWFWDTSAESCKYVKVGTKEVDVFELRCGDQQVRESDIAPEV